MARATQAEVERLHRKIESLELHLDLETNRADRAVKALRGLYQSADLTGLDDGNPDDIELENSICQILGYEGANQ
jgi:hypothetical protein